MKYEVKKHQLPPEGTEVWICLHVSGIPGAGTGYAIATYDWKGSWPEEKRRLYLNMITGIRSEKQAAELARSHSWILVDNPEIDYLNSELKRLIKNLGITQADAAKVMGISPDSIRQVLNRDHVPKGWARFLVFLMREGMVTKYFTDSSRTIIR